jgi:hypothetical protein
LLAREASLLRRRGSFESKKWPRGDTWEWTKRGGQKWREIVCKKLFFFLWTVLHIQILLGLTITEIITDKLHMVLDLPRLATCGPRSKSSHNMQYFTEKFTRKNSTRLKARNKWALQSFHNKQITAKQRNLYTSKQKCES